MLNGFLCNDYYIRESIYEQKINKISNTKEKGCYNKYGLYTSNLYGILNVV